MTMKMRKVPESVQKKTRTGVSSGKSAPVRDKAIKQASIMFQTAPRFVFRVTMAWISEK
jgi:hypothetical protein